MALRPVVGALRHGEQTDHLHNTAAGRLSGVCLSFLSLLLLTLQSSVCVRVKITGLLLKKRKETLVM